MNGRAWAFAAGLSASLALPGFAQSLPDILSNQIDAAKAECTSFENGTFDMPEAAIQQVDLSGNGQADDWVFDYSSLQCSSAASLFCGTGGCSLDLIVGDTVTNKLVKAWSTVDLPNAHAIILQIHGANCGGTNMNPCFEALVWDDAERRFFSLAPDVN